jgi:heptose I phosphotransferase
MLQLSSNLQSIANFEHIMSLEGEVFRAVARRKTVRVQIENKNYFAKLHWGVGWREIFKNLLQLRLPIIGAKNEWRAIQRLQQLNIATMQLAGYGCQGINPAKQKSFVITEELTNTISLEDFCREWAKQPPTPSLKMALIKKISMIARTLHENGVNHRDFYLCHFLLDRDTLKTPEHLKLFLIDLHRVQLRKKTPARWKIKDIAGLYFSCLDVGLSKKDVFRFIKIYRGQSLKNIFRDEKAFWLRVQKRAFALYQKTNRLKQKSFTRFVIHDPKYNSPAFENLLNHPESYFNGTLLKHDATTSVVKAHIDDRFLIVKRYNIKSFWHAMNRGVRKSRAHICWENAERLIHLGINTAKPVAMIEKRLGPFRSTAYFISEHIEGELASTYFSLENSSSKAAKHVSALIKQLYQVSISHGDLKATNIIISQDKPWLIDLDGMRQHFSRRRLLKARRRDIKRFMRNWATQPLAQQLFSNLEV